MFSGTVLSSSYRRLLTGTGRFALGEGLFGLAYEDAIEALQKTRDVKVLLWRRIKQVSGFVIYFVALGGSVSFIIFVSTQVGVFLHGVSVFALSINSSGSSKWRPVFVVWQVGNGSVDAIVENSFLSSLSSINVQLSAFVVPVTVSVFNAAIPKLVQITSSNLEQWDDPGMALRMDLWRMYVLAPPRRHSTHNGAVSHRRVPHQPFCARLARCSLPPVRRRLLFLFCRYLCKVLNSSVAILGKLLLADPYYLLTFFLDYPVFHEFVGIMRTAIASVMNFEEAGL